ncbi:unnamed protein product [Cercopithifilaria johnstoni]|uniref:Uncharacterized protein n=1 Tax=Cercopithifilaria johnstoni TaxID=2874296 RepID=A0A8J2PZF0_9BILA|nr:unnamed protein product [Cercopithifilaria johnstoni]
MAYGVTPMLDCLSHWIGMVILGRVPVIRTLECAASVSESDSLARLVLTAVDCFKHAANTGSKRSFIYIDSYSKCDLCKICRNGRK